VEREGGEVKGQYVLWCLWVPTMEFHHQSFHAFDVFSWPPLVLFNPVTLPVYQIFQLISENLAVQNTLYFILFNSIFDLWWRGIFLYVFGYGVCAVGLSNVTENTRWVWPNDDGSLSL